MTVSITGMAMEDIPAHVDWDKLREALHRMTGVLYEAGARHFLTRLKSGVDLLCAGYVAREKAGGRMKDVTLEILFPGAGGSDEDERRVRVAIYRYAAAVMSMPPDHERFMRNEGVVMIDVRPDCEGMRLAEVVVDSRYAPGDAERARGALGSVSGLVLAGERGYTEQG